jgi:hypothetical protein
LNYEITSEVATASQHTTSLSIKHERTHEVVHGLDHEREAEAAMAAFAMSRRRE